MIGFIMYLTLLRWGGGLDNFKTANIRTLKLPKLYSCEQILLIFLYTWVG